MRYTKKKARTWKPPLPEWPKYLALYDHGKVVSVLKVQSWDEYNECKTVCTTANKEGVENDCAHVSHRGAFTGMDCAHVKETTFNHWLRMH